jgi:hypothetical protein
VTGKNLLTFTISRRAHFVTLLTFALIATKCINTCLRLFAVMHSTIGTLIYVFAICLGLLVAGTTLAGITSDLVDTCPTWATPIRIGSALINILAQKEILASLVVSVTVYNIYLHMCRYFQNTHFCKHSDNSLACLYNVGHLCILSHSHIRLNLQNATQHDRHWSSKCTTRLHLPLHVLLSKRSPYPGLLQVHCAFPPIYRQ